MSVLQFGKTQNGRVRLLAAIYEETDNTVSSLMQGGSNDKEMILVDTQY